MKTLTLGGQILASRIAYGCAPLGGTWDRSEITTDVIAKGTRAIRTAVDAGINFFDHADIYCMGKSETVFSHVFSEMKGMRETIYLQSKVGMRLAGDPTPNSPQRYDFSYPHMIAALEGTLKRLQTTYLDIYLLHRPDSLIEPEEVAKAFDEMHRSGKVRHFGVSNHNRDHIELLRKYLNQPLLVNQVELSLVHSHLIDAGISTNQNRVSFGADGTLDFCRLSNMTIQAWGPIASGRAIGGTSNEQANELARVIGEVARLKGVSKEAIAVAWLLRHPSGIQPVIGSMDPERITAIAKADTIELNRDEWYALFAAGRGVRLP